MNLKVKETGKRNREENNQTSFNTFKMKRTRYENGQRAKMGYAGLRGKITKY